VLGAKQERHVERLVPVALDAYVPADNLYRQIEAKLDLTFVREWGGDRSLLLVPWRSHFTDGLAEKAARNPAAATATASFA